MDSLFVSACQGLGLAMAAGVLAGAAGRTDQIGGVLAIAAVVVGAFLFAASLSANDHTSWPGYLAGLVVALAAYVPVRDISAGAGRRATGSPAAVASLVAVAALVLAGVSLLFGPIAILAAIALAYLALGRRRKAARKHEGLRVLR
jgi:chromate transport protein ChrA